jgi:hypothetical protein
MEAVMERSYLDELLILPRVELAQVETFLRVLASRTLTPLPARLQRPLATMQRQVHAILQEVRAHPEALLQERAREDQERDSSANGSDADA